MSRLTIHHSECRQRYPVCASDLNSYDIMHGGRLLTLCDEIGYLAARTHAGSDCLTRAVHEAQFHRAAHAGETLALRARVGLTGRSSLWTHIEVHADQTGSLIMDAVFVFVAIVGEHRSRPVPTIHAESYDELQLQQRLEQLHTRILPHR